MLNQLVRYAPVTDHLAAITPGTLLDVGSGGAGVQTWIDPAWRITALDRSFDDYGSREGPMPQDGVERIEGDARDIPFADTTFDAVLALDVMEHVPPGDRPTALRELARVTRRRLIVGCPAGAPALEADRRLAAHCRRRGIDVPPWLTEHIDHGFPEPTELRDALVPFGAVLLSGNENVGAHRRLVMVELRHPFGLWSESASRRLRTRFVPRARGRRVARALARVLAGFDRAPAYRTFAVLDRAP